MHLVTELPVDSELSLSDVVLPKVTQLGVREKGTVAKPGFARSAPQNAGGIGKSGAGVVVTCQWELSLLGGKISELWVRESSRDENMARWYLASDSVICLFIISRYRVHR